ncbi:polyhydroxyalkanoic acid system family protein [Hyphomicrobium denitrificans]|uniref:polyhydroxyalkanoic acid system family protein n=1 Tax=Hyphomicrobium denitrificans TaxID=53399 RepID=UPI00022E5A14|nr:polyhydroxyalkanoic acid system family protein [Hyphomicrobium denitrificans]
MPKPIVATIPHSLGKDEAMRRLKSGLGSASSSVPILRIDEETWADNRLTFRLTALGQTAEGTADVEDDSVRIEVVLPWFLQKVAEMVQTTIASRTQILLEKK